MVVRLEAAVGSVNRLVNSLDVQDQVSSARLQHLLPLERELRTLLSRWEILIKHESRRLSSS